MTNKEALLALLKESNANGNDLVKRNKVIDLLVLPRVFDKHEGEQTERFIQFAIDIIDLGLAAVWPDPTPKE